ncbi:BOS complex subunit NOMO1 isoform X2 [Hydra vulgaris]|uniref:BOS complex subunit NOMO1 isoform X2 n=1 Tax=Hydra vulgaris TaxID=6087 RepID=A0ABM4BU05_HYDVU
MFFIILQILFVTCHLSSSQDIVGCGGFVQSNVPISFEKIEVKLYTKLGAFKFKTECAPNNGYFLVAIYDNGEYVLQINPPQGWSFSPSEINLKIDGQTDPCSKGDDLNFVFTGFSVVGMVKSFGREYGPPGVAVNIYNNEGTLLKEVLTNENGSYSFSKMMPGTYVIKAMHKSWTLANANIEIVVQNDNFVVDRDIVVSGYDVQGSVLSSNEPIQDVAFILYSSTVQSEHIHNCEPLLENITNALKKHNIKGSPICMVHSSKEGLFSFPVLPSGDYTLVPFYEAHNMVFEVVPSTYYFTVGYESMMIEKPFQVYGFSVKGQISDTKGIGIDAAIVTVKDSKGNLHQGLSDRDGWYMLANVTTGDYQFKVEKENYFFDVITIYISPNTPVLSTIKVQSFSICGIIEIFQLPQGVLPIQNHKVLLTRENEKSFSSVSPKEDGSFCFKSAPGKFIIEIPLSSAENRLGFLLNPPNITVELLNKPILDIKFKQFRAQIKGVIKCSVVECSEVSVYMVPEDGQTTDRVFANIDVKGNKIDFSFVNVLPGKYKVVPLRKKWCWEPLHKNIEVYNHDIENIEFQHNGFYLKCSISHNITLNFALENNEVVGSFELKKGLNQFCFTQPGIYTLTPQSCYHFEQAKYTYNTLEPTSLRLSVVSFKIILKVSTTKEVSDMKIIAKSLKSNKEFILTPLATKLDHSFVYEAEHWGRLNEDFLITPLSKEVLFYPEDLTITTKENCPGAEATFVGKEGMFIEGHVFPDLAGVSVTILTKSNKLGNRTIETSTDDLGRYRVGPLHSDLEFIVSAMKDGYVITKQQDVNFLAQKLSSLHVQVLNEKGVGMSSVLMSLSGGQYRSNNLTNIHGFLSFTYLNPGQYFLRPMQKEYKFEPSSKMIDIKEGEELAIVISGTRVAFSCVGFLSTLSGIPQEKVAIEAVGIHKCSDLHEASISDASGQYRIRGLQPGCSYNVRSKSDENLHIERLAPYNQVIQVSQEDINDLNFIVFMKPNKLHIAVSLEVQTEYLSSLKVMLYEEETERLVHVVTPGVVKYISFPPVPPMVYVVKIQTTLSSKTHEYRSTSATIAPDKDFKKKHAKLLFEAKERNIIFEPTQSVFTLPLAVAIVFLVYNYDSVLIFFMTVNSFIHSINKSENEESESDRDDEYVKNTVSKKSKKQK